MKALKLFLLELQTKLHHINIYSHFEIHSHWLKQKVQRQSIKIRRVSTKDMVTNGLTKALSVIKHKHFMGMTEIEDKRELLTFIKRKDDLRDAF